MFAPTGLAISLPGAELAALDLPGSVTEPQPVLDGQLSAELRAALLLVLGACRRRRVPVRVVARPEIFTHGDAERWVRSRLGDVVQHLCISDGTTIKQLPGCRTHVFFYRLGSHDNYAALQRLSVRAPELVACVESQINTALPLGVGVHRFVPAPLYLTRAVAFPRPPARLLPFFFNRHSAEDSANRIARRGEFAPGQVPEHAEILYLPLTEAALQDAGFARAVTEIIVRAFDRPHHLLVLRLPWAEATPRTLTAQMEAFLPRLRDSGITIPRFCPPNVLLATDDLAEDSPLLAARPWTMMFHESFDFWRHTEAFYRRAERVVVVTGQEAPGGFLPLDVAPLFGPRARRIWLRQPSLHRL
jgi:hypothetical protein